jgi:hypothetical protein
MGEWKAKDSTFWMLPTKLAMQKVAIAAVTIFRIVHIIMIFDY